MDYNLAAVRGQHRTFSASARIAHSRVLSRPTVSRSLSGGGDRRQSSKALPADARTHNLSLVLRTLYNHGPMSRAAVARATGLTKVTISDLVAELIKQELVKDIGRGEVQGPGKPAFLVDLARESFYILSVDLSSHDNFKASLVDFGGKIHKRHQLSLDAKMGSDASELVSTLVVELLAQADRPILGIGIGSPGIVDFDGSILTAPNLGWVHLPLQQIIQDMTGLPTIVSNDANAAALAEIGFGDSSEDLILVSIGHGIGAGLLIGGQVVQGSRYAAGEIGQVMVGTELGLDAPYSREMILEHRLSVPSLEAKLKGTDDVHREAILRDAGRWLGVALAPVIGALNLDKVVLSGPPELLGGVLVQATFETIQLRTMANSHDQLKVRMTDHGEDIVMYGCASMVLTEFLGVS